MAAVRWKLGRVARKQGHEGQIWNIYSFSWDVSDKSANLLRQGRENIANALYGSHLSIKEDIPGSALAGRKPSTQKDTELKFWLRCRGDSCKRMLEMIYTNRKVHRLSANSGKLLKWNWKFYRTAGKKGKNAPVFQRGEMDRHIGNSPRKRISGDKIPWRWIFKRHSNKL